MAHIPGLSGLPVIGPLLFSFDGAVYASLALYVALELWLRRSRGGLLLRAIGEAPKVAHSLGQPVMRVRYLAVLFGGAMSGLGGAYLSTALTPMWVEGMSSGRGWIALALVVFATWKPLRVVLGAYLFGGVTVLQLHAQAFGIDVPGEFLSMLPVRGHDRGAGDHLPRSQDHPAQPAGIPRPQLPSGRLT